MKNIGLLLSSVVVIECCVMSTEVRADVPETRLTIGALDKESNYIKVPPAFNPRYVKIAGRKYVIFNLKDSDSNNAFGSHEKIKKYPEKEDSWESMDGIPKGCVGFPIDGRQPTTEDAADYSGARIALTKGLHKDSKEASTPKGLPKNMDTFNQAFRQAFFKEIKKTERLNEKITSWYMYVFGGKDVEEYVDVKIEAADAMFPTFAPGAKNIINLNIDEWKEEQIERIRARSNNEKERSVKVKNFEKLFEEFDVEDFKRVFWTRFKTIASDPVGRVLLYRILIEIWRTYDGDYMKGGDGSFDKWKEGAVEHFEGDEASYFKKQRMNERNKCRSLNIGIGPGGAFWPGGEKYGEAFIRINLNHNSKPTVLKVQIDEDTDEDGAKELQIRQEAYPADVSLYHEMLHWLHFLRNPVRYFETETIIETGRFSTKPYAHIFECYYGTRKPWDAVLSPWIEYHEIDGDVIKCIKGEEVCTILGAPDESKGYFKLPELKLSKGEKKKREKFEWKRNNSFLNGDDLSENAYRLSRTSPEEEINMRFGHDDVEDETHLANSGDLEVTGGMLGYDPITFKVAHDVATRCYKDITGIDKDWNSMKTGPINLEICYRHQ